MIRPCPWFRYCMGFRGKDNHSRKTMRAPHYVRFVRNAASVLSIARLLLSIGADASETSAAPMTAVGALELKPVSRAEYLELFQRSMLPMEGPQ